MPDKAPDPRVEKELEHRRSMWDALLERGGPREVPPGVLRDLAIFGGAQGVWVDKSRTSTLTGNGTGVTVGLLHTGVAYADDRQRMASSITTLIRTESRAAIYLRLTQPRLPEDSAYPCS